MLLRNATLATMHGDDPYGLVLQGAILVDAGRIVWLGKDADVRGDTKDRKKILKDVSSPLR